MTADEKIQAFELLITECSTALADVVETLRSGQASRDEISNTLADMLGLMESRKRDDSPLREIAAAIRELRTPEPSRHLVDYEMSVSYDGQGRIEKTHLRAIPRQP